MTGGADDHYTVLGVAATASAQEITRAFHRLARRYHPDSHAGRGRPAELAAIVTAYQVLRDPVRRAEYDRELAPRLPGDHPGPVRTTGSGPEPAIRVGPVRYHGRPW
jgi:curved DNA-binding protein CbpA